MLGLCCFVLAFSSCSSRRGVHTTLLVVVCGLLTAVASVTVAHGLSCSVPCVIFPDQGRNPFPLHWRVDS